MIDHYEKRTLNPSIYFIKFDFHIKHKTMEYKLIKEISQMNLEEDVNNHLKQGWSLQGGISVSKGDSISGLYYYQALVK